MKLISTSDFLVNEAFKNLLNPLEKIIKICKPRHIMADIMVSGEYYSVSYSTIDGEPTIQSIAGLTDLMIFDYIFLDQIESGIKEDILSDKEYMAEMKSDEERGN